MPTFKNILYACLLLTLAGCRCRENTLIQPPAEQVRAFFAAHKYYVYADSISGTTDTVELKTRIDTRPDDHTCLTTISRSFIYDGILGDSCIFGIDALTNGPIDISPYKAVSPLPWISISSENTAFGSQSYKRVNGLMHPVSSGRDYDSTSMKPASVQKIAPFTLQGKTYPFAYILEDTAQSHTPFRITVVADVGITEVRFLNSTDGKIHTKSLVSYK